MVRFRKLEPGLKIKHILPLGAPFDSVHPTGFHANLKYEQGTVTLGPFFKSSLEVEVLNKSSQELLELVRTEGSDFGAGGI